MEGELNRPGYEAGYSQEDGVLIKALDLCLWLLTLQVKSSAR